MLQTRFTKIFQCRVPILGAPMAGVSGGALAAATAHGGAVGFLAAGYLENEDELRRQVGIFREKAPRGAPLCVGFITHACTAPNGRSDKIMKAIEEHRPFAVQFFAPAVLGDNVAAAKALGVKVIAQVGTERDAREAMEAGVDGIMAQGREAGGHGLRSELGNSTLPLAARLVRLAQKFCGDDSDEEGPLVLAAGGIVDGRGLAASLALGCDGCVFGTRLWAASEALGPPSMKKRLVHAGPDDVLRTQVFDKLMNAHATDPSYKWSQPYDSVGVLQNDTTRRWQGRLKELDKAIKEDESIAEDHRVAMKNGDGDIARVYAGEGVGDITSIVSAENIIKQAEAEAAASVKKLHSLLLTTTDSA